MSAIEINVGGLSVRDGREAELLKLVGSGIAALDGSAAKAQTLTRPFPSREGGRGRLPLALPVHDGNCRPGSADLCRSRDSVATEAACFVCFHPYATTTMLEANIPTAEFT